MNRLRAVGGAAAGVLGLVSIALTPLTPAHFAYGSAPPPPDKVSVSACYGFPAPGSTFENGFPRLDGSEPPAEATIWSAPMQDAGALQAWGVAPQVIQAPAGFACTADWAVADGGLTVLLAGPDDPCYPATSVRDAPMFPFSAAPSTTGAPTLGLGDCLRADRPIYTITPDPSSSLFGVDISSSRPPTAPEDSPVDRVLAIFSPGGAGLVYDLVCPYFPNMQTDPQWALFVQGGRARCDVPEGRTTQQLTESVTAFYDAAPASGDSATAGVVLMSGAEAVCTLPTAEWPLCETILANFVGGYGASWDPSALPASVSDPELLQQRYTGWDSDAVSAAQQICALPWFDDCP